ncbi:hypothetical protein WJM97_13090 [Okeanomitos corallinicola TIOX110]|uniref:Uncharacterized protein n=1 Tax=Okeanomitos corallinicola TIOX110 TaxID=3133117 RepID=A0ABZ2UM58_9CYAN
MKKLDSIGENNYLMLKNLVLLFPYFVLFSFVFVSPVFSQNLSSKPINSELSNSCSQQSLESLITQLMLNLPSYANRVTQRSRRLSRDVDIYPYILAAGKPELKELPLNPSIDVADQYESKGVDQVLFTTVERQYIDKKAVELQQFHWLFLTKTHMGWQVVMMFTQTGEYPVKLPIAPPRNSSDGAIAQAVKLWLRDCEAGSIKMQGKI